MKCLTTGAMKQQEQCKQQKDKILNVYLVFIYYVEIKQAVFNAAIASVLLCSDY